MKENELESHNLDHMDDLEEKPFSTQTRIVLRWLILMLLGFSIFIFLQMKETRIDILKVGTPASKYIVAQIDFSFIDEEKNFLKRQEAIKSIGPIYKIDEKQLFEREIDLDSYLVFNPFWRASAQGYNFQDIYSAVDNVQRALFASRYTDLATLAVIGKLQHSSFLKKFLFQFFKPHSSLENEISIPSDIWSNLVNITFAGQIYDKETLSFVVDYYKQKNWNLKEDNLLGQMLQKMAQDSIPNQYSYVQAGERIIDEGQLATTRNIAMLVAMKKKMRLYHNPWKIRVFSGIAILSAILCFTWCIYLCHLHPDVFYSAKKMLLLTIILVLTLGFYKGIEYLLLRNTSNILEHVHYPIIVPFAAVLLGSLVNARVALFSSVSIAIVLSLGSAMDRNGFFIANVLPAIICVMAMQGLHKRKQVLNVLAKAFFVALPIVIGLDLFKDQASLQELMYDSIATLGFMLLSAVLIIGLMPLFETLFRVMTDVSLMEFMDPSNPLLRRLMVEAPGTYQHSIVVGNLSEAAAIAVGANGLFCRVSTQYHDIGKLIAPQYFTENQQSGLSMHQLLTPLESAQVIISHITEGVNMARKEGLPESFVEIIREHHGDSLVYYFYHKQIELMGGDGSLVNEKEFRYFGPKPRTKESAIIMIADSLEAASRCLDEFSEETVSNLVERIVSEKAEDGQFDECQLTFEELQIVKKTLIKTICAYGHSRIKYPLRGINKALSF